MALSTSEVAVCCSTASPSSRVSRATSVTSGAELERGAGFGALPRFGSGAFWRRPLAGLPPALERFFIASPVGSGGILLGQTSLLEVAVCSPEAVAAGA